jgi:hypothetical protein
MIALRHLAALLVLLASPAGEAEQADKSSYILFVHTGADAKVKDVDDKVRSVLTSLLKAGYSVRKPDTDRDVVGGPGVDYFNDGDKDTAEDVAKIVNETYQAMQLGDVVLRARLQKIPNPPHYFGVWLF